MIRQTNPEDTGHFWPRGHYGESRTVTFDGVEYMLNAGLSDWTNYYEVTNPVTNVMPTDDRIVVVTRNYRLGYVGVGILDPDHHDAYLTDDDHAIIAESSVVFFSPSEPDQIGPRDTLDYTDLTIIRRTLLDG